MFFSLEQTTEKEAADEARREEKRDMIGGGPGRELSSPPSDGISNLRFSNHSDHLLVSSWDTVRHFFCSLHLPSSFFFPFSVRSFGLEPRPACVALLGTLLYFVF